MFISKHFLASCLVIFMVSLNVEADRIDIYQQTEYFEGDIVLRGPRNGILDSQKWSNYVVPYVPLGDKFSQEQKDLLKKAMKEIEGQTCIRFVPRTTEANYTFFHFGGGCSSSVGMYGGAQGVSLADGCWYHGTIVHELLHALGLWHEQSRYDRDNYIYINEENILDGTKFNFELKFPNETSTYGVPYNYLSVMHYAQDAFSKNGEPTIEAIDPAFQHRLGNRDHGTNGDYEKLRKIYKCTGSYPSMPTPSAAPAPVCEDKITYCDQNKANCGKDAWLNDYCRRTCGICTPGCKDDITYCRQYKNDCGKLDWLKTSCRKTCKFCKPF